MKAAALRCPTCRQLKKRGNPANQRYWLLLHLIADGVKPEGQTYSPEQFHIYFKTRFIGVDEIRMPNGHELRIPKSSADLDTAEFAAYMQNVEAWAMERNIFMDELEPT